MEGQLEREKRELFHNLRREIRDGKVLNAMEQVPRELFVPPETCHLAYKDIPLPIGEGQTISQVYIVALMASALELRERDRVMELGTGSGYQAAVLSRLATQGKIISLERIPSLAQAAELLLRSLNYKGIEVRMAGPTLGCPEGAPFDAIIVAAAAPRLPASLLGQLRVGGRMVIPIGSLKEQELTKVLRTGEGHTVSMLGPCRFVPLIGEDAWAENNEDL